MGADLSGGLDSSAAVVLAADAGAVHAVTYTGISPTASRIRVTKDCQDLGQGARTAHRLRIEVA